MRLHFRREKLAMIPILLFSCSLFVLVVLACLSDQRTKEQAEGDSSISPSEKEVSFVGLLQRLVDLISDPQKGVCGSTEDVGGNWDFGFLDGVWTICLDNLKSPKASKNCLVYSFGIGSDWSFDDAMHDAGCEVYSFDPTIGKPSHKRNDRHWFYNWGLVTDVPYIRKEWTLLTFEEIRERLGHKKSFIDVVKMDVEGAEWRFLDSSTAVFDNIGQLTLEIHPFRYIKKNRTIEIAAKRLSLLERLRTEFDMKLFHVRRNPAALDLVALSNTSWFANLTPDAYQKEILYELSFVRIDQTLHAFRQNRSLVGNELL